MHFVMKMSVGWLVKAERGPQRPVRPAVRVGERCAAGTDGSELEWQWWRGRALSGSQRTCVGVTARVLGRRREPMAVTVVMGAGSEGSCPLPVSLVRCSQPPPNPHHLIRPTVHRDVVHEPRRPLCRICPSGLRQGQKATVFSLHLTQLCSLSAGAETSSEDEMVCSCGFKCSTVKGVSTG